MLEAEAMRKQVDEMVESISSREYLDQLAIVSRLPPERRVSEAAKRLTPEALSKAGVRLPRGARVSSRYFEEDFNIELADQGSKLSVVPVLEKVLPGFLDDLRVKKPDLLSELLRHPYGRPGAGGSRPVAAGTCTCVGGSIGPVGACYGSGGD